MWVVVRWFLLLPILLCCFSTIRRDINSLPWYPFSVTISLLSRLWEKPVYVLLYTHTPLTQVGKVLCELCKRKRCYNHSSVTGLVKSASWIVINYAALISVLWALSNAANCNFLALCSGVDEVFFLQGCDALSNCNRFLKIRDMEISSCTFSSLKMRPLRCFESWESYPVTRRRISDELTQ